MLARGDRKLKVPGKNPGGAQHGLKRANVLKEREEFVVWSSTHYFTC